MYHLSADQLGDTYHIGLYGPWCTQAVSKCRYSCIFVDTTNKL